MINHNFKEDLADLVDKHADSLPFDVIGGELISYSAHMMVSVSIDKVATLKIILNDVIRGISMHEQYKQFFID